MHKPLLLHRTAVNIRKHTALRREEMESASVIGHFFLSWISTKAKLLTGTGFEGVPNLLNLGFRDD